MNETRTDSSICAETEPSIRYEVVSCVGVKSPMKFDTIREAIKFAEYAFPDQEQDPDRTGRGWDVQVVGA